MNRDNSSELFPVVDETGRVVGCATRGECHDGRRLLHPVVHLHLFNSRGELYLQKRPLWKDIQPGRWDAVGGHVDYGETPDETAPRSTRACVTEFTPERLTQYIFDSVRERELVYVNRTVYDGPVTPSDETDGGRFLDDRRDPPHTGHGSLHAQFRERIPPRLPNGRRDRLSKKIFPSIKVTHSRLSASTKKSLAADEANFSAQNSRPSYYNTALIRLMINQI